MAFVLLLVYMMLLFVRPMEWVPGLIGSHIMLFVGAAAVLATLMTLPVSQWRFQSAPQNWLMVGFFAACLMSHVRHTYFAAFVDTITGFGRIVLLYFLVAINVSTLRRLRVLVGVMILGCLFMTVHGILQWHSPTHMGFGVYENSAAIYDTYHDTYRVRAFGFFNDPNDLALMLVTILPFLIGGLHRRGVMPPRRLLNAVMIAAIVYCIFRTNSRGGWLALAAMLVAYAWVHARGKKLAVTLGVMCLAGLMALGPSRMGSLSATESSARNRLVYWAYGNRMLKAWPIFGAGMGRFEEFSDDGKVAHNSFVHCYAELGLLGYFFWLALLVACMKDSYALGRIRTDDPERQELGEMARACFAALIGYMAAAFFLSRTYIAPLYILFGIFAALRAINDREFEPAAGRFEQRDLRYALLATLLSIPALYVLLRIAM